MTTRAALITPSGAGGVAAVQLRGCRSIAIIKKIFRPGHLSAGQSFVDDKLLLGSIYEDEEIIDQVIVCVDGDRQIVDINCHGGPRIIQRLLMLLRKQDVEITTWDKLHVPVNIAQEVAMVLPQAKTRMAVLAIAGQHPGGLYQWVQNAIDDLQKSRSALKEIQGQIEKLMATLKLAQKLLDPCQVVIAGAVNCGKSTLANALVGKKQSITADIPGTTRDWTAQLTDIEGLGVNLIDTAGRRISEDHLEQHAISQGDTQLQQADLVLLVVAADHNPAGQLKEQLGQLPRNSPVLVVVNKSDLTEPGNIVENQVNISALTGHNLGQLRGAIAAQLGLGDFEPQNPLVFTQRQYDLLAKAVEGQSAQQVVWALQKLRQDET